MGKISLSVICVISVTVLSCSEPDKGKRSAIYDSSWKSLEQYRCPEWFRDAKFGIWSCWNAYTVPAIGDWYARAMYWEGSSAYNFHVKNYGHPSVFGYKDVVELWKGEHFNPDSLVSLFKESGAKYVVAMAVHHDNFDLWDSRYHPWNSVNNGPHQNIVGKWETAVRKAGLHWGITSHLERSWNWFRLSHGADKSGPYQGVPYDGADPNNKHIYHDTYGIEVDDQCYGYSTDFPRQWIDEYTQRIMDLLTQHKPDLFYMDGGIPFGVQGRELIAWYYNQYRKWIDQDEDPVMNIKNYGPSVVFTGDFRFGTCVEDVERGQLAEINRLPWQTDNSIGDWFWKNSDVYITPKQFVDQLIDIVSKNGNLLMNVPLRADGTLDEKAIDLLKEMGRWLQVNGEGIYGTRPYVVFGEGPGQSQGGHFTQMAELTARDFRFTTKGDTVYAFVCGKASGDVNIQAFRKRYYHRIQSVGLLGGTGELQYRQDEEGLKISMPDMLPSDYAVCLKIIPQIKSK